MLRAEIEQIRVQLRARLSEEQFLELVGVTAVANVIRLLGIVLQET